MKQGEYELFSSTLPTLENDDLIYAYCPAYLAQEFINDNFTPNVSTQ